MPRSISTPSISRAAPGILFGLVLLTPGLVLAQGNTFTEMATSLGADGYARAPSNAYQTILDWQQGSLTEPVPMSSIASLAMEPRGMPGIAILDYDDDGDLDVLTTNGPGAGNTLHQNQLAQTGSATYVEVAAAAGIDTVDMDVNGVCYGDTDNDGDPDVLLLGRDANNAFFENNGDGTFTSAAGTGLDADTQGHTSCTLGDLDGDGLLDLVVANAFDLDSFAAIFVEPFALNHPNQLFLNNGDGTFREESERIAQTAEMPPGAGTITWATSIVDLDADGDLDIVFADDSGAIPTAKYGGVDRSYMQLQLNDGAGNFTPAAVNERPESPGSWMGVGFGDFDHDGVIDVFGSNFGDYGMPIVGLPYALGDQQTRVLFGRGDASFDDVPGAEASGFGWGNAVFDVDNDGDSDALYHGGLDMEFFALVDNPGIVMTNDGAGNLSIDLDALGARHVRRNVHGVAIGDLDRDGFVDVANVSNFDIPAGVPLIPGPAQYGGPLDAFEAFTPTMTPTDPSMQFFEWSGISFDDGSLSIELNNGESGYGSVSSQGTGSVGITEHGKTPRDGTGAVFSFRPQGSSSSAMMPITAGSSHLSAHAQEAYFGLGEASHGTLDVAWPGGTKNRLYVVYDGEHIDFPELGCSYDDPGNFGAYASCVAHALGDLRDDDLISSRARVRFLVSALVAYFDN